MTCNSFDEFQTELRRRGYIMDSPRDLDETNLDWEASIRESSSYWVYVQPRRKWLGNGKALDSVGVSVQGEIGRRWHVMEALFWSVGGVLDFDSILSELDTTIDRLEAAWRAASQQ